MNDTEAAADPRLEAIRFFAEDRWQAHQILFRHRHPDMSADAHKSIVDDIYDRRPRRLIEGFRGIAKSTLLEEAAVIKACYRDFRNMVIVGASYSRAVDRLTAIKNEFDINPYIGELFGNMRGSTWQEGKIVLTEGSCIQALGRDQSMTGLKHLQWRPDAALVDDLEDPEEVRSDPERQATWDWFMKTFLPSLDRPSETWVRVLGTRRGVGSLPERLENAGWPTSKYPIYSLDDDGNRQATWPGKFPLNVIDDMIEDYKGDMHTWYQEFMCKATSAEDRVFTREMFRYEPRVRVWEAVYCMIDPARTSHGKAASTGWAAWSWLKNRLVVWGCDAHFLAPDEIVSLAFDLAERFDPVWLGVEKDGLEEFLLQPIRHEQVRRGITIPYRGVPAISGTRGLGQRAFIGGAHGLQPYFAAREVIFVQQFPALEGQLLSFPHGIRDAANALAYAPTMRPAQPIYDGFTEAHIVEDLAPFPGQKLALAANATGAVTTAILLSQGQGVLRVLADWVFEGPPADRAQDIAQAAILAADAARLRPVRSRKEWDDQLSAAVPDRLLLRRELPGWVVPPHHSDRYTNVGLLQAIRRIPADVRVGGAAAAGGLHLRDLFSRLVRGESAIEISPNAKWTLRALAGGYTRQMIHGRLRENAEEGPYRVLMEGLESFCGLLSTRREDNEEDDNLQPMRVDERSGVRYASAMPQGRSR